MCKNRKMENAFEPIPSKPDFPKIEHEVLKLWESDGTFEESVQFRQSVDNDFVFYDGPPFANGLPHYGHVLTGYVKDVVPRTKPCRAFMFHGGLGGIVMAFPQKWKWRKPPVFTAGIKSSSMVWAVSTKAAGILC